MPFRCRRRPFTDLPHPPSPEAATKGLPHFEEAGFDRVTDRSWKVDLYLIDVYSTDDSVGPELSVQFSCRSLGEDGESLFETSREFRLNKDPTGLVDESYYAQWVTDITEIPRAVAGSAVSVVASRFCRLCPRAKSIIVNITVYHSSWFFLVFAWEDQERYCGRGVGSLSSSSSSRAVGGAETTLEEVVIKRKRLKKTPCCVVCMDKFKVGSKATRMPCSHVFHGDCILKWLHNSHVCPLCRFEMPS